MAYQGVKDAVRCLSLPPRLSPRLTLEASPPRSALHRPKSCQLTSAAAERGISQEISRLEVASFFLGLRAKSLDDNSAGH